MYTDYSWPKIIDHVHGKTSFTMPSAYWIALSTTVPTRSTGSITEPVGGAYARVQVLAASWGAAVSGAPATGTSVADATFAQATANWGTIQGIAAYDASSGGNYLEGFDKDSGGSAISVIANNGDTLSVVSGSLVSKGA